MVVIANESHHDTLLRKITSIQRKFIINESKIDLLVKDFQSLYAMMITGDPNVIDIFSEKPIWMTEDSKFQNAIDVLTFLGQPEGQNILMYINLEGLLYSCHGIIKSARTTLEAERKRKRRLIRVVKRITNVELRINYVKNIFFNEAFPNPTVKLQFKHLRKVYFEGNLTLEDMDNDLQQLDNKYQKLKDVMKFDHEVLAERSRISKEQLSALLVKALL